MACLLWESFYEIDHVVMAPHCMYNGQLIVCWWSWKPDSKHPQIDVNMILMRHFCVGSISNRYQSEGLCYLESYLFLTHWGKVTHICVGNLTIIGSDNGLSPSHHGAIIWSNAEIILTGPLGKIFSEILIEIHTFSFKKCIWKYCLVNGSHSVSTSVC